MSKFRTLMIALGLLGGCAGEVVDTSDELFWTPPDVSFESSTPDTEAAIRIVDVRYRGQLEVEFNTRASRESNLKVYLVPTPRPDSPTAHIGNYRSPALRYLSLPKGSELLFEREVRTISTNFTVDFSTRQRDILIEGGHLFVMVGGVRDPQPINNLEVFEVGPGYDFDLDSNFVRINRGYYRFSVDVTNEGHATAEDCNVSIRVPNQGRYKHLSVSLPDLAAGDTWETPELDFETDDAVTANVEVRCPGDQPNSSASFQARIAR